MQAPANRLRLAGLAAFGAVWLAGASTAQAQFRDTIPSRTYYAGIQQLYGGEFRDAQRSFSSALRGAVKTLSAGATVRWVDSICYHAMLGETYFQWGQPQQALEQFNFACTLYLDYPRWMMRAEFAPQVAVDAALARTQAPWGASQRGGTPGRFPETVAVAQGRLDNSAAVQQGGVVLQPQLWPIDVVAINRALALAIRRRNEILGPLGAHDAISKNLAVTLARGGAPPNHWSNAWIDVLRGLALAGVGDHEQALQFLERGLVAAGQFDHPLTGVALLEQGRIALVGGNYGAAAAMFSEAGYSAYLYGDIATIDDSFRWGAVNRLAANVTDVDPALAAAVAAAKRDRFDYIAARCQLALADQLMSSGDWKNAAPALAAGMSLLGDSRTGALGNFAMYLDARLQFHQGRETAAATFTAALEGQAKISLVNFQIALANEMFDAQTLPTRVAAPVYEQLLSDPTPADAVLRPLESTAVMMTNHEPAFHRWLITAIDRKNLAYAVEVTERAKRRRFHNALVWGGRLNAVRDLMAAPLDRLSAEQRRQQSDAQLRFPGLADALATERQLRSQLDEAWRPPLNESGERRTAQLWGDYAASIAARERQLGPVAASRVPAEISFPPFFPALELQKKLRPGQALLVFHDTPDGLLAALLTAKASTSWNCGPSNRLAPLVAQYLRDLGNVDANHVLSADELAASEWQQASAKLYEALCTGSSLAPSAVTELVIVPDGVTWYVPFESLITEVDGQAVSLISCAKIRYAPTAALGFSFRGPWRRVQRSGVALGELAPGDKPPQKAEAVASLLESLDGSLPLAAPLPAPSPALATLLESLVVLDDVNPAAEPFQWTPLAIDPKAEQAAIGGWQAMAGHGPQRIALPGMHTAAERGGKAARRRGAAGAALGDELFFASCALMSAGAETALLSRWRVGGQSTLDMVREFMQELPETAAGEAWQRSVALAADRPVDPVAELRVKAGKEAQELTAAHPFFWAGYLVIDTGWQPEETPSDVEIPAVPAAPAGPTAPPPAVPAENGDQPLDEADADTAVSEPREVDDASDGAGSNPPTPPPEPAPPGGTPENASDQAAAQDRG